jgi:hypothetical protein
MVRLGGNEASARDGVLVSPDIKRVLGEDARESVGRDPIESVGANAEYSARESRPFAVEDPDGWAVFTCPWHTPTLSCERHTTGLPRQRGWGAALAPGDEKRANLTMIRRRER